MLWDSFLCALMKGMFGVPTSVVYRGVSVINFEQRGEKNRQPPPPPLECSGLNVKQHYILVIECLYFENLCVSRNANNGIYLKYTPCFCMLPPGGSGYPKNNTPFHILSPSLQHGLPWAIAPGGGWATCDA